MRLFTSFTSTWLAFASGKLELKDLSLGDYYDPQVVFAFNCARVHVIREDNLLPAEVSWVDGENHQHVEGIDPASVSSVTRMKYRRFLDIIVASDKAGIVLWGVSYQTILRLASREVEVFQRDGTFQKAERKS